MAPRSSAGRRRHLHRRRSFVLPKSGVPASAPAPRFIIVATIVLAVLLGGGMALGSNVFARLVRGGGCGYEYGGYGAYDASGCARPPCAGSGYEGYGGYGGGGDCPEIRP